MFSMCDMELWVGSLGGMDFDDAVSMGFLVRGGNTVVEGGMKGVM